VTDRLRYGFFAAILGVTGVALSVLGFLAARSPEAARLAASSDGFASLVTGLSFTAIACAVVLHYGRRSAQLTTAYQDLHRATLQRERSEAALRESERFTRATLDAMDAQIAVLDVDGVVMAVNRAWRARPHPLLRDAGACDVGSNYLTLCGGVTDGRAAEAARVAAAIRAIASGEREDCLLESHVPVDGRFVVTRVTRFAGKGPLRLVVAHQDVTALAAPPLDAPDPPAAGLAEASPIGLFRADAFGELVHANAHLLTLGGMELAAALGTGWLRMVHPDDRDAAVAEWQRLVDARGSGETTFRVVGPDRAVRPCRLRVRAVDGDARGFVGALLDVPPSDPGPADDAQPAHVRATDLEGRVEELTRERDRAGAALRAAEAERARMAEELVRLYDEAPCGYHALDADGTIVAINETACGWLGYRRAELIGERRFVDLLAPASAARLAGTLGRLADDGAVQEIALDATRKDGTSVAVTARLAAVYDAGGRFAGSRATLVDVTGRRRAAERVAALERTLAERSAALGDAHRRLDQLSRQLARTTRELESSARPVAPELQVPRLAIVRAHAGGTSPNDGPPARDADRRVDRTPVDMTALAHDVVGEVRRRHPARDVPVAIDGLAPARGDAALIRQALLRLVDNAFEQTAAVAHPFIDLGSVAGGDDGPVYYVRDNGAGFDMRRADALFDAADPAGSNGAGAAAGDGLALVQRIIEQHGGRIWAEGRIDAGATFFFTLNPRAAAEETHASPPASSA
jgi:PAS domain S-box-containing protein